MKNCKEISKLVSESMERKLKFSERMELFLHLAMCRLCRFFRDNLRAIQTATKTLGNEFREPPAVLSSSAKKRITKALKENQ